MNAVFKNCFTKECQRYIDRVVAKIVDSDLEPFPPLSFYSARSSASRSISSVTNSYSSTPQRSTTTLSDSSPPPSTSYTQAQLIFTSNFPSPIHHKSSRLTKYVQSSATEYPLPALFDKFQYDPNTSAAERNRHMLLEVIPRALEKALSIDTI